MKKKYIIMTVFLLCIIISSISAVSSADTNSTNSTSHNTVNTNNVSSVSSVSDSDIDDLITNTGSNNNQIKNRSNTIKSENTKTLKGDELVINTVDTECDYGNETKVFTTLNPNPTDGYLTLVANPSNEQQLDIVSVESGDDLTYNGTVFAPGVYLFKVKFSGSSTYDNTATDGTNKLTIYDTSNITTTDATDISINKNIVSEKNITFNVTAPSTNASYNPIDLSVGYINFYINDQLLSSQYINEEDGTTFYIKNDDVENLSAGTYQWKAEYVHPNTNLRSSSITGNLNVLESVKLLEITVADSFTANVGDQVKIPVTYNPTEVTDGILTVNYNESVNVDGVSEASTKEVSFNSTGYLPGSYPVTVSYCNGTIYQNTNTTTTINLYQATNITADKTSVTFEAGKGNTDDITFNMSKDASGQPIDGSIDIYMNDTAITTLDVNKETSEIFILTDENMKGLKPGVYNLTAYFTTGNPYINDSNTTVEVTLQSDTKISVTDKITASANSNVTIPINVINNGVVLTEGTLEYTIDSGTTKTAIDLSKSEFTLDTTGLNTADHIIHYSYTSDDYGSASATTTLTVTGRDDKISAKIENNTAENLKINVTLTDAITGAAITGGTVTITDQNSKEVGKGTVSNGEVTITNNTIIKGTYNLTVKYDGTGTVYNSNELNLTNVKIVGKASKITATLTKDITGYAEVEVTLTDAETSAGLKDADMTVTLKNGTVINCNKTDENGKTTVNLFDLPAGTTNILVRYAGNDTYAEARNITILDIKQRTTTTSASILNSTAGNVTIKVTVTDTTDNSITVSNGTIIIKEGDVVVGIKSVKDGEATVKTNITTDTSHSLTIYYDGTNTNFADSSDTLSVTPTTRPTTTKATVTNYTTGNLTIKVAVTDSETGKAVPDGSVTFTINSDTKTATVSKGVATIIYDTLIDAKDYTVKVSYDGTDTYSSSEDSTLTSITVQKRNATVDTTITNRTAGSSEIKVNLTDYVTGKAISGVKITITTGSNTFTGTTDTNGIATISLSSLSAGKYSLKIDSESTTNYNATTTNLNITVKQIPTITTASVVNKTPGNVLIDVIVKNSTGTTLAANTGSITIKDQDGNIIGENTPVAETNTTIRTNIDKAGTYNLTVYYNGTGTNYANSTCAITVVIDDTSRRNTSLTPTTLNSTYGNTTISIQLNDKDTDTGIANATITIVLPDESEVTTKTNADGAANVTLDLSSGKQTVTLTYAGNKTYNTNTTTYDINVLKRPTTVTAKALNTTAKQVTIQVSVNDAETGKAVPNGRAIIKEGTKIIGTADIINGNATVFTTLSTEGSKSLTVIFNGTDTNYESSTDSYSVTVVVRPTSLKASVLSSTLKNTVVQIKAVDVITGDAIANTNLTITNSSGATIATTKTGSDGSVKVSLDLLNGTNTITIASTKTSTFDNASVSLTLNVTALESKVVVSKFTSMPGQTVTLRAYVTNMNNTAINGGNLVFKINGKTISDSDGNPIKVSVVNGVATLKYTIPLDFKSQSYKLSATFSGAGSYGGSVSDSKIVNLKKREAKVTVSTKSSAKVNTVIPITITVIDKINMTTPIIDGYVILKFNGKTLKNETSGKTIQLKLDSYGKVVYNYTIPKTNRNLIQITAVLVNAPIYTRSEGQTDVKTSQVMVA